ncbi:D-tagatose-bisphosphate aldolase, class II, non-catalytic subunit [Edaphobacter albus]|uniref:D-tagatose-bisphosphate aldolase, class II, non-catalytic subunit n=1 Tax=Edaphobacter sp. 4G125 TaxID=2763071 RepID=UPI001648EFA0|nr:D-tagatose-bisphosphate aldolase, class II, non-catalytic subunit [Edaphobacter sp. 4G125]QNI36844.1 D-tagatose-bisphosphate aldolase, class II, non-catalytic subunit [Edaphobacter sp. 4G125]
MSELLRNLLKNRSGEGASRGIYSVCSSHPWALRAALRQAVQDGSPVLIEATSNQVNQEGGYTGMRPKDFRELVFNLAKEEGVPEARIILGGDHLGPNPWRKKPATEAMALAEAMVREYAAAGFTKIHLDASMACTGDPEALPVETVAERSAQLCLAAEEAAAAAKVHPVYVIGTEVPTPGGATESISGVHATATSDAEQTYEVHRRVFAKHGLEDAWSRVVAMVVQPGVEFNHDSVSHYDAGKARELSAWIDRRRPLVFEAHSTDYQLPEAYRELVRDGFAILKVGPAVTFAMREAIFALTRIEDELVPDGKRSNLRNVVERVMLASPKDWEGHYHGSPEQQRILRTYSYSDRIRYYWNVPEISQAVEALIRNLNSVEIPETLISAYLPLEYEAIRAGVLKSDPTEIVLYASQRVLVPYAEACF